MTRPTGENIGCVVEVMYVGGPEETWECVAVFPWLARHGSMQEALREAGEGKDVPKHLGDFTGEALDSYVEFSKAVREVSAHFFLSQLGRMETESTTPLKPLHEKNWRVLRRVLETVGDDDDVADARVIYWFE